MLVNFKMDTKVREKSGNLEKTVKVMIREKSGNFSKILNFKPHILHFCSVPPTRNAGIRAKLQ